MDQRALFAILLSTLAGLSTAIGGLIVCCTKNPSKSLLCKGLAFSAGVMMSVSFMDLIPQGFSSCALTMGKVPGGFYTLLMIAVGMLFAALIESFVPERPAMGNEDRGKAYQLGILSILVVVLHNMPEGIATFLSSYRDLKIGIPIAIAIALHNIPEGIVISVPIYYSTHKKGKSLGYALLSGLSEPVGALIAFFLLRNFVDDFILGILYALIAGIMIFISIDKLLPSAFSYGRRRDCVIFTGLGMIFMNAVLMLTE